MAGDYVSVHSDAPALEDWCPSLSLVLLDDRFEYGFWRGATYDDGWHWQPVSGTLIKFDFGDGERDISVPSTGHYIIAARDEQRAIGEKTLSVSVNGSIVASSHVNTGRQERNSPSTAFLMQLICLFSGDQLRIVSSSPQENDSTNLMLVKLPCETSCAAWWATAHIGDSIEVWGAQQLHHKDYCTMDSHTKIRVARGGFYLVMVRVVHGGNSRRKAQLLHNSSIVAVSHVTTDGFHKNCSHLIEVVHAFAGEYLSVTCEGPVVTELYGNFSIVLLRAD